ncbi:PA domain-containing protein [Egicoccus sp. AB-alg2]|uniref:PA domain-containing protein n=1 Tax=Egicoccus sp. AB-alg2 TaxID=3242693 RepID=UPI00359DF789
MEVASVDARRTPRLAVLVAAVVALVAGMAPLATPPAEAWPFDSFCSNQQGGPPYDGFLSHEQVIQRLHQIARSSQGTVAVEAAGTTTGGREIHVARVGHGDTVMLVQSEIHGNEKHGTTALLNLLATLGNNSKASREIREAITFVAIPMLNADGGAVPRRQNVMSWAQIQARHPQLAGVPANPGAWYHNNNLGGMDLNRDFNPDLDYEPVAADLPGNSAGVGFYLSPESRTVRDVYRSLEQEFGRVDIFVDLHNQAACYGNGLPDLVEIDAPSPAAGTYDAAGANFGPEADAVGIRGDIVLVDGGGPNPTEGCGALSDFPAGAIALIDRGTCPFTQKVANAQAAGAVAVVIANNTAATPTTMGGTDASITIPAVQITQAAGQTIRAGLPATGRVADNPDSDFYTPLSISARFIDDPAAHGDWPNFDYDASRRVNVAVFDALQRGNSPFGKVTLYPQNTNLPGTALGSFALRGSAVILFETSGQTQQLGQKRMGMLVKQVEVGVRGIVDAAADGSLHEIDPGRYDQIPLRVSAPIG